MTQQPTVEQLIPLKPEEKDESSSFTMGLYI